MIRNRIFLGLGLGVLFFLASCRHVIQGVPAHPRAAATTWNFVVSGDSRNCGDVIMPAITAGVKKDAGVFYWHLGDLRAIYVPDEDYLHQPEHRGQPIDKTQYQKDAWDDFIANQTAAFNGTPYYLGIGNHEVISPKSRAEFTTKFSPWLDAPALRQQRLADNPAEDTVRTYYHWIQDGVDFIYLDNATKDQFDAAQMSWFEKVVQNAAANADVRALVVGMHEALPESLARGHSMNDWESGTSTGRQVYADLVDLKNKTNKPVYLLASHSHFYMTNLYDSDYWRGHGGVLPGWIVGTAGAVRYVLPPEADRARAKDARTKVYGYLLGTVHPDGAIDFTFREVQQKDIPDAVVQRYTPEFVTWCFEQNKDPKIP